MQVRSWPAPVDLPWRLRAQFVRPPARTAPGRSARAMCNLLCFAICTACWAMAFAAAPISFKLTSVSERYPGQVGAIASSSDTADPARRALEAVRVVCCCMWHRNARGALPCCAIMLSVTLMQRGCVLPDACGFLARRSGTKQRANCRNSA